MADIGPERKLTSCSIKDKNKITTFDSLYNIKTQGKY